MGLRHAVPERRVRAIRVGAWAITVPVPVRALARTLGHETLRRELAAVAALGQVQVVPEREEVKPARVSVAVHAQRMKRAHV
jgi:hypothetical protein